MTTFSRLSYRCNYCGVRRRCAAFYNARAHLSSARKHGKKQRHFRVKHTSKQSWCI